jgi:saccharopine dehydrogenase-like NADP-dependent oxidoreductase
LSHQFYSNLIMKNVLIAGAGKSSTSLINYMLRHSETENWNVTVIDSNLEAIEEKLQGHKNGKAVVLDINDTEARRAQVQQSDIVLSVMPPHLHFLLAQDCLVYKKHLITSSYISEDILALNDQAAAEQLLFMCEMGCDPGIDHMSTAKLIDEINAEGGDISSFISCCGGLVAPESDTNLWHYKISWNPYNVVTAGQAGAMWFENERVIRKEYKDLFNYEGAIEVEGFKDLAYYPNRDSIKYKNVFNQPNLHTFVRATVRYKDYMIGWSKVVDLKLTNIDDEVDLTKQLSYKDWVANTNNIAKAELDEVLKAKYNFNEKTFELFNELGLLSNEIISIKDVSKTSSAKILQDLIERKWKLQDEDKDMIIMQHLVKYELGGRLKEYESTLVVIGEDRINSAMAKTVGLPMAILGHKILDETFSTEHINGVKMPIQKEVYSLVLPLLEQEGIKFVEHEKSL